MDPTHRQITYKGRTSLLLLPVKLKPNIVGVGVISLSPDLYKYTRILQSHFVN